MQAFIRRMQVPVGLDGNQLVDVYDGKNTLNCPKNPSQCMKSEGSRKQLHDEKQSSWLLRNLPAIAFSFSGLAIAVASAVYIMWQEIKSRTDYSNTCN